MVWERAWVRPVVAMAVAALVAAAGGCSGAGGGSRAAAAPRAPATGIPAQPAGTAPTAALRAGERLVHLGLASPYLPQPPSGGTDDYRCFLLDPGFAQRAFITGSLFEPQNARIVHHAIFFRVPPDQIAQARQLDAQSPGAGWTCFGGTGIGAGGAAGQLAGGGGWIAAWAPGAHENLLPTGTGYEMQPGSQIVMQVHYNLLATGGRPEGTDSSGIVLRVTDGSVNLKPLQTSLLPAPVELPCLAGQSGPLCDRERSILDVWQRFGEQAASVVPGLLLLCNGGRPPTPGPTQHCDRKVRAPGMVYAVAGHMHLLGRSIKVELDPGTPRARVLLDVPVYNFDDQGARFLPAPVAVKPGDTYRVTCTHDATLRQELPELKPLPPRYVVWGEGTSDEMCLGIVIWSPA